MVGLVKPWKTEILLGSNRRFRSLDSATRSRRQERKLITLGITSGLSCSAIVAEQKQLLGVFFFGLSVSLFFSVFSVSCLYYMIFSFLQLKCSSFITCVPSGVKCPLCQDISIFFSFFLVVLFIIIVVFYLFNMTFI